MQSSVCDSLFLPCQVVTMKRCSVLRLLLPLALCWAAPAMAQSCMYHNGMTAPYQLSLPLQGNITVGADVPDGTVVYYGGHTAGVSGQTRCGGGVGEARWDYQWLSAPTAAVPGRPGVYQTGIPGIGVRFIALSGASIPARYGVLPIRPDYFISNISTRFTFNLIKIGPVSAGTLQGSTLPTIRWTLNWGPGTNLDLWHANVQGQLNIVTGTCSVRDINVPLGTYAQRSFTGIGRVSGWVDHAIELSGCPAFFGKARSYVREDGGVVEVIADRRDNALGVRLDPTTAIIDPARSIMALQEYPDRQAARGLGIQVALPDGTPVGFGVFRDSGLTLTEVARGNYRIPLRARYIQMEDRVRPGPANGAMVVTLRYE